MEKPLFSKLNLPEALLANLESLGYAQMTPIQAQALPIGLQGKDLIGQARTGSGKTAAFGIPLLHKLEVQDPFTQALVVCPTRELSIQVSSEIRRLARYRNNVKVVTLYGGQAIGLQKAALKQGAHIVVGTPGRLRDHLFKETLSLDRVGTVVLDEADRMLEMGFLEDMIALVAATPSTRQTLLFSATFPEDIQVLSARFQRDPIRVDAEAHTEAGPSDIAQTMCACDGTDKLEALVTLLARFKPRSALVFCNTKVAAKEVLAHLEAKGFSAAALHGDMEQRDREKVLMQFKHQGCRVLVATDVAARGLDIEELSAVINFEVPHDAETYVHRIGRTGRAGRTGQAYTLVGASEKYRLGVLQGTLGSDIPLQAIESLYWEGGESGESGDVPAGKGPSKANKAGKPETALVADKVTLCIAGGRKDKIRAGDILGALTGEKGIEGRAVGKIDVMDYEAYVTVDQAWAKRAFTRLSEHKIKGKKYRVRML